MEATDGGGLARSPPHSTPKEPTSPQSQEAGGAGASLSAPRGCGLVFWKMLLRKDRTHVFTPREGKQEVSLKGRFGREKTTPKGVVSTFAQALQCGPRRASRTPSVKTVSKERKILIPELPLHPAVLGSPSLPAGALSPREEGSTEPQDPGRWRRREKLGAGPATRR